MTTLTSSARHLVAILNVRGSIPAARCSSARASGHAKNYSYWGAAQYEIRVGSRGYPIAACVSAASSDRRSHRLAEQDTDELAERLGGIVITEIGRIGDNTCDEICKRYDAAGTAKRAARKANRRAPQTTPRQRADALYVRQLTAMGVRGQIIVRHGAPRVEHRTWANTPVEVWLQSAPVLHKDDGREWIRIGDCWGYDRALRRGRYYPTGDDRDLAAFQSAANVEERRMIYTACGGRLAGLLGLREVHRDDFGTLYNVSLPGNSWHENQMLVKVVNATPEPDGSFRDYFLRVPGGMRTARQAVAWTFGLAPEAYNPSAQS